EAESFGRFGRSMSNVLKPWKLPMNRCVPLKARSELANASMFANRGSGGAFGSGGGPFGSRSGGVGAPAGCFGSKNPVGFERLATRSRPRIASPASCSPAFRPTRGSLVDCAPRAARHVATAIAHRNRFIIGPVPQVRDDLKVVRYVLEHPIVLRRNASQGTTFRSFLRLPLPAQLRCAALQRR